MRRLWVLAATCLTPALFACAEPPTPRDAEADVRAIDAVREREATAFAAGDAAAALTVYTPDVEVFPADDHALVGHGEVRAWLESAADQFTLSARCTDSRVTVLGDHALELYTGELSITPRAGGETVTETIKGIHVYQRQADGSWRIHRDVWNADPPPAGAAGTAPDRNPSS